MEGTIHLVRHGEVENPAGVIYGRLPGYHLSERGRRQARSAALRLAERNIAVVWASPLERAQETAQVIAEPHRLEVVTDERLVESGTTLEGLGKTLGAFLRTPGQWWNLRNPLAPSWGEPFRDIRRRMLSVIAEAVEAAGEGEAVVVSHQTPVQVARLALAKRNVPPWLGLAPCVTGSVSTVTMEGGSVLEAAYFAPAD